ncbi:hypothetical protein C8035_v012458 [Colletotrichum spinosum]|uniref:Uncharacterized protein n=1 Tax=Colletotrichum spinosum TaxID=1347390 RepID=A0A4R8Q9F9_9PEZI|nr:hypothetical protein C8035_v012458 [Colletotrichum spinosum]
MQLIKTLFAVAFALAVPASAGSCLGLGACGENNQVFQCATGSCISKVGEPCSVSGGKAACPK